ncbi:hypothetical protein GQ457_17G025010 [Hibiscus cannabinus]
MPSLRNFPSLALISSQPPFPGNLVLLSFFRSDSFLPPQISPVTSSRSPESESDIHFAEKCSKVHKKRLKRVKASLPEKFGIKQPPTKTESDQNRSNLKSPVDGLFLVPGNYGLYKDFHGVNL